MRTWIAFFLSAAALTWPNAAAAQRSEPEPPGSRSATSAAADRDATAVAGTAPIADTAPVAGTDTDTDIDTDTDTDSDAEADTDPAADAVPESVPPGTEAPVARLSLLARSSAGTRGEAAIDALARARAGPLVLLAGAGASTGPRAPPRVSALVGLEVGGEPLFASLLLRLLPPQAGASLVGARGELRWSSPHWALAIAAEGVQLSLDETPGPHRQPALALFAAALSLEAQRSIAGSLAIWARGALGASALALDRPGVPRDVWQQPGLRALQWPQRASAGAGLRLERPGGAAALGLAVELPADPVGTAAELSLAFEHAVSAGAIALELTAGRLFPSGLWLGRAALEIRFPGG